MKMSSWFTTSTYLIFWCISIVFVFFFGFILGQSEAPETALPFLATVIPEQEHLRGTIPPVTEKELTYDTILQQPNTPIVVPNDTNVVEKDKKTPQTPKEPLQNIVPNTISPQEQMYKFSLQLLAVKQKKSAEEYRDKLKEHHIATDIVEVSKNGISWYRVYTTFTGTISQFEECKDRLASLGVVDTILRERTPQ